MADRLITIANFAFGPDPVSEAELANIKLGSEGIRCFLAGKNFVGMYWLYSGADHGVKLQVKESNATRALEILCTDEKIDIEELKEDLTSEPINPPCPKCHSEDVEYERFSKAVFYLSILFFRFPIPFFKRSYKCKNCGHTWK